MQYCTTCKMRRCFQCNLHSVSKKSCSRCKREYGMKDTHCYRCYICPICDSNLELYPLLYKSNVGGEGIQFELIKSKTDKSKIVGKAVQFRCVSSHCKYNFKTAVETKPQSLQQIVQNNIKDEDDIRYKTLIDYYDWCLNYQRVLDKGQRMKLKSEILNRFKGFEIAKILEETNNQKQIENKEIEIVQPLIEEKKSKLLPLPKQLHADMNNICPTCLENINKENMCFQIPVIYSVPMIGFSSSNIKNIEEGEFIKIPILVSIINSGNSEMNVSIIEGGDNGIDYSVCGDVAIPFTDKEGLQTVPTCLLSYVSKKEGNWKEELAKRDQMTLSKLKYEFFLNRDPDSTEFILESGLNWVTLLIVVNVQYNKLKNSKVNFTFNLGGDINVQYHCCALL
ncbi:hypothetical protein C6P40_002839 [Pichia californica]|uniref:Dynactin subunit 4 n=1 Tax=Pichia californica TaxID=460514 RepID=A0A9P6WNW7_9ASCO|nr:hypothetical protein C6P40_002839 [[Candida] californica]